jgi:hypothetical protein
LLTQALTRTTISPVRRRHGNRKPAVSGGLFEADEGARTLDLLHGKASA